MTLGAIACEESRGAKVRAQMIEIGDGSRDYDGNGDGARDAGKRGPLQGVGREGMSDGIHW